MQTMATKVTRRTSIRNIAYVVVAIIAAILITRVIVRYRSVTIRGAVFRQSDDPNKEAPIAGVRIEATEGSVLASAISGPSGGFAVSLQRSLIRRHSLTLTFRHPDFRPFNIFDPSGEPLYVVKLMPLRPPVPLDPEKPLIHISNIFVRYTVKTEATVEIGSGVKTFQVDNTANVPCNGNKPCSPDGKWKAAVGSASLDAGPDNEFRNGRVSCIAGPCPFTDVQRDDFSKGGRTIGVTVRNWSDTTTFLLQAEAVRRVITDTTRKSYPVIVDHTIDFSLPASAEGTCIEAEVDGMPIVFPIGPNLWLSWANCETQLEPENNRLYRCELKPGYAVK
jgi:hypothetical protein